MTEDEARETIKTCGWTFLKRQRKGRYWYVYAARMTRKAGGRHEKYIGSLASLEHLAVEELKRKLSCA